MSIHKSYAVLGLGRYGKAVATELVNNGAEVLAVDMDEDIVNAAIADIPYCKCADVTEADVIRQLGIANIDVVIVGMANNLEASVMAIMLCKEVGVKNIIAKCSSEMHRKILLKVGADKVVFPENESGIRLAKNLLSSGFVDLIELSEDVSMVELDVKQEWQGKTILQIDFRRKYGINIVAIRSGEDVCINVNPDMKLEKSMKLIVIANTDRLERLK